jgi:hypothetical protein
MVMPITNLEFLRIMTETRLPQTNSNFQVSLFKINRPDHGIYIVQCYRSAE